ncbi:hypothetical protein [Sinorhizobium meliloti]|uniref:hypothetical protein n=1 Tax=Rhizobium meliloti TaxID=382 RepID=UPI000FDB18DA|nr:hypothetical protein [Sinorhizobium meliloti]RVM26278.1 hypothetical protein CN132_16590 [Sinorhizobium meliloti]
MDAKLHHTLIILSHETFAECVAAGHHTVPVQHFHLLGSIFVDVHTMPIEDVREFFDVQPDRPDILWSVRAFGAVYDTPDGDEYYLSRLRDKEEPIWHHKHRGWGDIPNNGSRQKVLEFYRNISAHHPMINDDGAFRFVGTEDNDSLIEVYSEYATKDDKQHYRAYRVRKAVPALAAAE